MNEFGVGNENGGDEFELYASRMYTYISYLLLFSYSLVIYVRDDFREKKKSRSYLKKKYLLKNRRRRWNVKMVHLWWDLN